MPYTRWLFALLLAMAALAPTAHAQANRNFTLELPAQPLGESLTQLATQTGVQIVFFSEVTQGLQAPPLSGDYTPGEAVNQLLTGTDLVALQMDDNGSIAVQRQPPAMADEFTFDIPAQSMAGAVQAFERLTGLPITYSAGLLDGLTAKAVQGSMSVAAALAALFDGTGVEYAPNGNGGVTLNPVNANVDFGTGGSGTASVETARRGGVEEIIVTGQKKAERLQDVPIAISAFDMESLDAQKIEGGFDLLKAIPNVTFSKTNFTGYNFQIRGIGTQAISATTDPGVAVSFNNTTLIVNRLFEQEYLDIERVEVLRGPQGTLYGRNATAGVINVISAKPKLDVFEGEIKIETGNFDAQRLRAHYNFPLNASGTVAGRVAYSSTVRDGYGINEFDGSDVDDRDLWTGRLSLLWQPTDRLKTTVLWERFSESDRRVRSVKQLCHRDPGRDTLQGFDIAALDNAHGGTGLPMSRIYRDQLTQGCLPGSLHDEGAFGTPNGLALPFVAAGRLSGIAGTYGYNPYSRPEFSADAPCDLYRTAAVFSIGFINLCNDDPYGGLTQSRDLRTITSEIKPLYKADADLIELAIDFQISDELLLSSQTVYVDDSVRSTQDLNRFKTATGFFNDSAAACGGFISCEPGGYMNGLLAEMSPGGVLCDPQLGCSNRFRSMDLSRSVSTQFNQEVRLVSSFDGDLNYSFGANFTRFETLNDYFVFSNTLTALTNLPPFRGTQPEAIIVCRPPGLDWFGGDVLTCIHTDDQSLDDLVDGAKPTGHNYFLSRNPYELQSMAAFGELYWEATANLKITGGLRITFDQKTFTPVPSQALLMDYREGVSFNEHPSLCYGYSPTNFCGRMGTGLRGGGYPAEPDIVQTWVEPTGRLGVDWKPVLGASWIDESLVYAFYTRGYKAGGANPSGIADPAGAFIEESQGAESPRLFKAEYVNAFEIGTKNRLFDGALTVNANAFYYDYRDYQVSKIVNRSAANENFDATIWGTELEVLFAPTTTTVLNATLGYLKTRIDRGEKSIDLMDRTQGGGQMFVTGQINPAFDPQLPPRAVEDYVAGLDAPADQEFLAYDDWVVVKPSVVQTSNCVLPADLLVALMGAQGSKGLGTAAQFSLFCPGGSFSGYSYVEEPIPGTDNLYFNPITDAPNATAGFFADLSGRELPNAPNLTVSLGAQKTFLLPRGWEATARADWYWQGESFARVYNTHYDRLRAWDNTNISAWVANASSGLKIEAYVKNLFDETPITGAFLGSDDTGLTTNVFTLDPRLIGVSISKQF